jgi:hypothetical protein
MKKIIRFAVPFIFGLSALLAWGYHSNHIWAKISEMDGVNGTKVCQWQCTTMSLESHVVTTSGYICPQPPLY